MDEEQELQANHIVSCCFNYYIVSVETPTVETFIAFVKEFYNLTSLSSVLELEIIENYNKFVGQES